MPTGKINGMAGGVLPSAPPMNGTLLNATKINGNPMLSLNEQRMRGVSVDRYREYQTPGYYEDTYYTREEKDRRVTVKHVEHPPLANGRLERHSSHPNLRPRPSTAGGRRLPKTPQQPPGTIIVIENVVSGTGRGRTLPDVRRAGSSAAVNRPGGRGPPGPVPPTKGPGVPPVDPERRSLSLPRRPTNTKPKGTGRCLPKTPQQSALPLQHHNNTGPPGGGGPGGTGSSRKRELPKPQSLELRHSNREVMNSSNASLGLGGLVGRSSRSMNFPRLEGSPTHSECSSESGHLLSRSRYPNAAASNVLRSNSMNRRKLPEV